MTPQKARLMTLEEIEYFLEQAKSDSECAGFLNSDVEIFLETARAALKVVEAAKEFQTARLSESNQANMEAGLFESLQPFQQTGERCKHGVDGTDCFDCFPSDKGGAAV